MTAPTVRSVLPFVSWPGSVLFGRALEGACSGPLSPSSWRPRSGVARRLRRRMGRRRPARSAGHHDQQPGCHHDQRRISADHAGWVPAASRSATRRWLARQSSDPVRVLAARSRADPTSIRRPSRSRNSHLPLLPVAGRHRRVPGSRRGATDLVPDRHAVCGHPRDGERPRPAGDDRQQPVPLFHGVRYYLLVAVATGR